MSRKGKYFIFIDEDECDKNDLIGYESWDPEDTSTYIMKSMSQIIIEAANMSMIESDRRHYSVPYGDPWTEPRRLLI